MDLLATRELELRPAEGLNHMFLVLQEQLQMDIMTWPMWTLATVPWGFPKALCVPVWSLDRGQHASHECPLERAVSRVP